MDDEELQSDQSSMPLLSRVDRLDSLVSSIPMHIFKFLVSFFF